jgi:glycosyltransferase involved in cell wall biosynthesis
LGTLDKEDYTFISEYDSHLPSLVLGYEKTKIVLLASRFEGFGLISLETLTYKKPKSIVIYSPIDTFKEVLKDYEQAIELEELNSQSIADCIYRATQKLIGGQQSLKLDDPKIHLARYDFVNNYTKGFNDVIHKKT